MSELDDIIIDRKKPFIEYLGFLFLPVMILVFLAIIIAPFKATTLAEALFMIPFWLVFLFIPKMVLGIRISFKKLSSNNADLKITTKGIFFFDYVGLDFIPFKDIKKIKIVYPSKSGPTLAICLFKESKVKSNTNWLQNKFFNDYPQSSKFILYPLRFARVNEDKIIKILKARIEKNMHIQSTSTKSLSHTF